MFKIEFLKSWLLLDKTKERRKDKMSKELFEEDDLSSGFLRRPQNLKQSPT